MKKIKFNEKSLERAARFLCEAQGVDPDGSNFVPRCLEDGSLKQEANWSHYVPSIEKAWIMQLAIERVEIDNLNMIQ